MSKRQSLLGTVICLYSLPLAIAILYRLPLFSPERNWGALGVGLLLLSIGSLCLYFYLTRFISDVPEKEQPPAPHPQMEDLIQAEAELTEATKKIDALEESFKEKETKIKKIYESKQQSDEKISALEHQLKEAKEQLNAEIDHQKIMIDEYAQSIKEQREIIRKKQKQISDFEGRVHDLSYEVKTLLQLADAPAAPSFTGQKEAMKVSESAQAYHIPQIESEDQSAPVRRVSTIQEAKALLKRCVETAQKTTHTHPFSTTSPRMRNLPIDNYALDFRRLFDNLRSESSGIVLLYSQRERKLLFSNQQAQARLGWSTEQVIQHFPEFVQEGYEEWTQGLTSLEPGKEKEISIILRDRSGDSIPFLAFVNSIPTGIFKHHAIIVLYPAD